MNSGPTLFLGLFLAMAISWVAFVLEPQVQIGNLQQTTTVSVATLPVPYPNNMPGDAQQGAQVYRANGCQACHTQQARPDAEGRDLARGWGRRRSVAEDYLYEQTVMLGSLRVGPDLANAGMRMDTNSILVRLYNPRALLGNGSSVMPPYPYLFETRKIHGAPSPEALQLPPEFAPAAGYEIVPTRDAETLAAYVLSLRQDTYLFDVPPPAVNTNAAAAGGDERPGDECRAPDANEWCCEISPPQNPKPAAMELAEPVVGSALVPVWMIVLIGALFYWCQIYLDGHAGGFGKDVYAPFDSFAEVAAAQPKDESAKFLAEGADVFVKTCSLCHQLDGRGKEGQFPSLVGSDWVKAQGPNRLGRIVLDGATGPITINGNLFNVGGTMMAFRTTTFTDEQLAAVLSYVRKTFGDNSPPFKPEQIKAVRAATASHVNHPWTADELLKVNP